MYRNYTATMRKHSLIYQGGEEWSVARSVLAVYWMELIGVHIYNTGHNSGGPKLA
jgi:hypothetical protein